MIDVLPWQHVIVLRGEPTLERRSTSPLDSYRKPWAFALSLGDSHLALD